MTFFKSYILIFLINVYLPGGVRATRELDSFLQSAMSNYSVWLQTENLDPSMILEESVDISGRNSLTNFNCEISNQFVTGHTKEARQAYPPDSDLLDGTIQMYQHYGDNITFKGNYKANGTILGNNFSGSGSWSISADHIIQDLSIAGFTVKPDGIIDLSTATIINKIILFEPFTTYFEGLWDDGVGGFGDFVKQTMEREFYNLLSEGLEQHPINQILKRYLQEKFNSYPLSEIIEWDNKQFDNYL